MEDEDETVGIGRSRRTRIDVAEEGTRLDDDDIVYKKGTGEFVSATKEATSIPRMRRARRRTRQHEGRVTREGAAYKERRVTRIEP